jgi:beta-glucosidase
MPATTPAPQDADWLPKREWLKRHQAFLAQRDATPVDLLFVGDSITEGWLGDGRDAWDHHFAPLNPLNLGIGGDETQHVLWRLDHGEVDGLAPKLVVLLIGTNNLGGSGHTPRETAAGVAAVVAGLRAKLPTSPILLLAVLPRDREPTDPLRQAVVELNHLLAPLADGIHVHYLDVGPIFLTPAGVIPYAVMPDYLHLSPAAYAAWADAIVPTIRRLMSPA